MLVFNSHLEVFYLRHPQVLLCASSRRANSTDVVSPVMAATFSLCSRSRVLCSSGLALMKFIQCVEVGFFEAYCGGEFKFINRFQRAQNLPRLEETR